MEYHAFISLFVKFQPEAEVSVVTAVFVITQFVPEWYDMFFQFFFDFIYQHDIRSFIFPKNHYHILLKVDIW